MTAALANWHTHVALSESPMTPGSSGVQRILEASFGTAPARVWEGRTASGIPVHCFVTRVAVADDGRTDHSEFVRELQEHRKPTAAIQAIPLRLVL